LKFEKKKAIKFVRDFARDNTVVEENSEVDFKAIELFEKYSLQPFDSKIIATALLSGCSILYSEDLQDGLVIEVVETLGYNDVRKFAVEQARRLLEQKASYYQGVADTYQQKYRMTLEEFEKRVIDKQDSVLSKFGIIEKEDDNFEWRDAEDANKYYSEQLNKLSTQ